MDRNQSDRPRRWVLEVTGAVSLIGVAGCFGNGDSDESDEAPPAGDRECIEDLDTSVPEAYETAESIDGIEREPSELETKDDAGYQCSPQRYMLCANCRFFIARQDDHDIRACTAVDGEIASQHWCGLYQPTERLDGDPNPLPHD